MKKTLPARASLILIALLALVLLTCQEKIIPDPESAPVITGFSPSSGVIGTPVAIYGNNFVPPVIPRAQWLPNTSIVKFNGSLAVADRLYQMDSSHSVQRLETTVPAGATSGKITITAEGITATSLTDFIVTTPVYVPNVTVTTVASSTSDTVKHGRGVAVDADGNLYVTNWETYTIYKITPDGAVTVLFTTADDSPRESINFGIAVDNNGNVYAAVGHTICKIAPDGAASTLAGGDTDGDADGQGVSARFNFPWGVAVDAGGNVYVGDMLNNKIRKITPDGTVSTLAGSTGGFADGQGANARFGIPMGVAVDAGGNIFVADNGNNKIRKITPEGNVTSVAGSTTGYNDGSGDTAQFNAPYGIALDAEGNMYIGDGHNYVIRKVTPGGDVTTVAGSTHGFADGTGASAQFGHTRGVALDTNGIIYAADDDYGKIRKIVIN